MEIQIKVTGVDNLIEKLKQIPEIKEKYLRDALVEGSILVVHSAIEKCPYDTGYLRSNIRRTEPERNAEGELIAKVGVNDNVGYAQDVEFGYLKGKKARKPGKQIPFLRPAFDENFNRIQELIKIAVKQD